MWIVLAIVPGVIVGYIVFLRPVLRALPQFKEFYEDADSVGQKLWALCGNSITLAFSYGVQVVGWALQMLDPLATLFGDPALKQEIADRLQASPAVLGYVLMGISAITIAARLRSLAKAQ